jgi:hypothetical protein
MASGVIPAVGHWYQNPDQSKFEVIALDEDEGVIEIQYFDGELDEMEFDVWPQLGLEGVSPPEDWTGAYDGFERDDLGYTDLNLRPDGYSSFVDKLDTDE